MSVLRTYTTGFYNTLLFAAEARKLKLFHGEKWMLDLPDGDRLCLLINEPEQKVKNHVVIVVHGLAGAAMDPSTVSIAQKFLEEGYHVVRMNLRGAGGGAGHARNIYHAGRDGDLESVVHACAARFPGFEISMIAMSLSSNMLFRYLATKESAALLSKSIALSPVIDLEPGSKRVSNAYFGLVNKAVMSMLKSYFIKRKRAFADTSVPDWNIIRKMDEFDELFIAPELGFKNAKDYYAATTALPLLNQIDKPWHIVLSLDDPIAYSEKKIFAKQYPKNSTILRSGGHLFMKKHGGLGEVAFKSFSEKF
jgi:predicted alpha/beta-fold hydrolase